MGKTEKYGEAEANKGVEKFLYSEKRSFATNIKVRENSFLSSFEMGKISFRVIIDIDKRSEFVWLRVYPGIRHTSERTRRNMVDYINKMNDEIVVGGSISVNDEEGVYMCSYIPFADAEVITRYLFEGEIRSIHLFEDFVPVLSKLASGKPLLRSESNIKLFLMKKITELSELRDEFDDDISNHREDMEKYYEEPDESYEYTEEYDEEGYTSDDIEIPMSEEEFETLIKRGKKAKLMSFLTQLKKVCDENTTAPDELEEKRKEDKEKEEETPPDDAKSA